MPENPTFSSVRDQSSKLSPAAVREVTFLGSRLIRGDLPSPPGCRKKMLPFVREKRHLSLIPLPFPAGFHLNHDSCGHTLLVSSERRGPVCVHMCVRPVRDYSPKEGRHYWTYLDLFGKGMRGTYVKRVEKEKRQWNLSVRSDLMGGMMNLEVLLWSAREGDDSSFLLFSCSSVFVKSRADDIYQREDSWS